MALFKVSDCTNGTQVQEMLKQLKPSDFESNKDEEFSKRHLDDASQLKDSQEENKDTKDDSLSDAGVIAIIVGGMVGTLCAAAIIIIIWKMVIDYQNKKIDNQNLKRYSSEFNIRTDDFIIATGGMKFEQTDCAICLSKFEQDGIFKVIKTCQHIFHSE